MIKKFFDIFKKKPVEKKKEQIVVSFDHGLGDCTNFAHLLYLYRRHGHDIRVVGEENKKFIWQSLGLEPTEPLPEIVNRHPWFHPKEFWNKESPDHLYNKNIGNVNTFPLPTIDASPEDLWKELCSLNIDIASHISDDAYAEADNFLKDLGGLPIVAMHAVGTSLKEDKNLSNDVQLNLQISLANAGYSVVILDFDSRAVQVGHEKIKGILPSWKNVPLDRLAALLMRCSLLIAVDSGPLNFSRMLPINTLGVFFNLLPNKVVIPWDRLTCMVPHELSHLWREKESQGLGWNFIEYNNVNLADEISTAAQAILNKQKVAFLQNEENQDIAGKYTYERVGHDARPMILLPDGKIGEGSGTNEKKWLVQVVDDRKILVILGEDNKPACKLTPDTLGNFYGRWLNHERMPILLKSNKNISPEKFDVEVIKSEISGKTVLYHRVGYDSRPLEFKSDGFIGKGAGDAEFKWHVEDSDGYYFVKVLDKNNKLTFTVLRESDGVYRGRWLDHEKMSVELHLSTKTTFKSVAAMYDGKQSKCSCKK